MASTAYAAPQRRVNTKAPVRVVRGGRYGLRKARQAARTAAAVLTAAVILLLVVAVVYTQAQVTRLSSEIDSTNQELTNAQSTYDYLSAQMSSITASANVQQIAEGRLGLIRADNSQITYIRLQEHSTVERAPGGASAFFAGFRTAALSLLGSLAP